MAVIDDDALMVIAQAGDLGREGGVERLEPGPAPLGDLRLAGRAAGGVERLPVEGLDGTSPVVAWPG